MTLLRQAHSNKYTRRYNTIVCEKCGKEYKHKHQCEYTCKCGKTFEKKQSYVSHCGHCKIHLGYDPPKRNRSGTSWIKGRTKETDESVRRMAEHHKQNPSRAFLGRKHSEETRRIMSEKARVTAKEHRNGWKSGNNRVPNRFELFAEQFLIDKGVAFEKEVVIPQSLLGKQGSYYQLDFLINNEIDLEIDGSAHNVSHDAIRDQYISKLYTVHRISHNDSIEQLEAGLNSFISTLRN